MWTRRKLLFGAAALALQPRVTFAQAGSPASPNFILVLLRGGLDGLATVIPHGDGDYERARKGLALSTPETLDLDGFFGLHPSLDVLHPFWQRDELLAVHAIASPYRSRSHFDAQKILENGSTSPHDDSSGWLNRALKAIPKAPHRPVAIGRSVPLVLRGPEPVTALDPVRARRQGFSFIDEVKELYAGHSSLEEPLEQFLISQGLIEATSMGATSYGKERENQATERTGSLIRAADGPNVAVIELSGFDTHVRQGTTSGTLANRLRGLGEALTSLSNALGPTWKNTVICIVSEFGRTVSPNGSGGTDHGTASLAMVLGGAVKGGRVIADWPGLGLQDLHEGRDLRPTTDIRSLFGGLLHEHMNIPTEDLASYIFPNGPKPLENLIR